MAALRRPADGILALLAAVAVALGGTPAAAQSDPFALPKGLTTQNLPVDDGPLMSEISVDGELKKRLVALAWHGTVLTIDADSARVAGLPVDDSAQGPIEIKSLPVAKWSFDTLRQRLEIQLLRRSDKGNFLDLHSGPEMRGETKTVTAFRLDYDVNATVARGRAFASGLFDATIVRGNLSVSSTMQLASRPQPGTRPFTRLDTVLRFQAPKLGVTAIAGDFVSAGGQSQRAVRMGGLQVGSDYSLRPDLVTIPLPTFSGQVAVPTGIDLINGDQRFKLGDIEPGEFTVRNIPAHLGSGEVAVITRDALGREIVQSTRFYVSRNLLAPNLGEFAVNAGFVRRRYGTASGDYGPLAGSIFYRRGLTSQFTLEGSAEWTAGLFNAGVRGDVALGGWVLLTAEARFSRDEESGRSGKLLNFGLESAGGRLSGRLGATLPSSGYRDVAAKLGDPSPPRLYVAQVSFDLGNFNRLQLSASRQEQVKTFKPFAGERVVDVVNASFRTKISSSIDLFSSLGYRYGDRTGKGYTAFAGLSIQLGNGRNSNVTASRGTGSGFSGNASFRQFDTEDRPLGYAINQSLGQSSRTAGSLALRTNFARFEGEVERVGSAVATRANARGTLIASSGAFFARNKTGGTYAIVRTGKVGSVPILRENRPAGTTGKNGILLVENIPPQVAISFDIDADRLPLDALARDVKKRVVIPRGAVGLVALDIIRFVPRQVRIVDGASRPLAAGLGVRAMPSGEMTLTGFDGVVEINVGADNSRLLIGAPGSGCIVELEGVDLTEEDAAPLVCRPAIIASEDDGADSVAEKASSRDARLVARRN